MRTALKKDEKILVIIRQHWIRLALPFFVWLLAAVLLIMFAGTTGFIITLVTALYPAYEYLNWKHNLWCVTNVRVVDESGFFSRYSKESPLDKINNVEYDQSIWGRILGFGNGIYKLQLRWEKQLIERHDHTCTGRIQKSTDK